MSELSIQFSPITEDDFIYSEIRYGDHYGGESWIDSSFSRVSDPVGDLRWVGVSNAQYNDKHPILNSEGEEIGFIEHAASLLGYTYTVVCVGTSFWVTHERYASVFGSEKGSYISIIEEVKKPRYMFSFRPREPEYQKIKSFFFSDSWVSNIQAFKLLNENRNLLLITNFGLCVFDTMNKTEIIREDFLNFTRDISSYGYISDLNYAFSISPVASILALVVSVHGSKDLLNDDKWLYKNIIRLYDFKNGLIIGEKLLDIDKRTEWQSISFGKDGHQLKAVSKDKTFVFQLNTRNM